MTTITIDFRLLGVSTELFVLEKHLDIIEKKIEQGRKTADNEVALKSRALDPRDPDDSAEFGLLIQERDFQIDFVHPRVLRGPFLVTLFAVYESAVTEIANRLQKSKGERISLEDIRGNDFLSRSKKYYDGVLQFSLSTSNKRWQSLRLLSKLRNVIAHTNGRLETVRVETAEALLTSEGISEQLDCIIVSDIFLRHTFDVVKYDLEDLLDRYKHWDSANKTCQLDH